MERFERAWVVRSGLARKRETRAERMDLDTEMGDGDEVIEIGPDIGPGPASSGQPRKKKSPPARPPSNCRARQGNKREQPGKRSGLSELTAGFAVKTSGRQGGRAGRNGQDSIGAAQRANQKGQGPPHVCMHPSQCNLTSTPLVPHGIGACSVSARCCERRRRMSSTLRVVNVECSPRVLHV